MVACLSWATIFNFPRRLLHKKFLSSKTSSRRVCNTSSTNIFKACSRCLQHVFTRCLQDVFKTSSRHLQDLFERRLLQVVFMKMSCSYVLKTSWKTKKCYTKYVFKASSVRLHQNECLLDQCISISLVACSIILHHKHPQRLFQLMFQSMRGNILRT